MSIAQGNELILIGEFGKLTSTDEKDQSPSTDIKALTRQTKNKITSIYSISRDDLEKLCSSVINTVIINYDTAPKIIKKIKKKKSQKHLKSWSCAPKKLE